MQAQTPGNPGARLSCIRRIFSPAIGCLILRGAAPRAALLFLAIGLPWAGTARASDDHFWLHVDGKHSRTSAHAEPPNAVFVPVGVAHCKDVLTYGPDDDVAAWCKARGCNVIRLSAYCNYFNGDTDSRIDIEHHIETFIDPFVQACKKNRVYVIIDNHDYLGDPGREIGGGEAQTPAYWGEEEYERFKRAWEAIAARYKDEPWVMGYELCNEPICSVATLRAQLVECIQRIRAIDRRHIIFLPSNDWTHGRAMWESWASYYDEHGSPDALAPPQIVHTFHEYPGDNDADDVAPHIDRFQGKYRVPVMLTEFGFPGRDQKAERQFLISYLVATGKRKIGWCLWPWHVSHAPALSFSHEDLWAPAARMYGSQIPREGSE